MCTTIKSAKIVFVLSGLKSLIPWLKYWTNGCECMWAHRQFFPSEKNRTVSLPQKGKRFSGALSLKLLLWVSFCLRSRLVRALKTDTTKAWRKESAKWLWVGRQRGGILSVYTWKTRAGQHWTWVTYGAETHVGGFPADFPPVCLRLQWLEVLTPVLWDSSCRLTRLGKFGWISRRKNQPCNTVHGNHLSFNDSSVSCDKKSGLQLRVCGKPKLRLQRQTEGK